ncbi:MAG: hypothetical protein ACI4R8_01335 [Candidatus Caccovivens sp.]
MANTKKELNKQIDLLVEDILDNYDKYSDEDKLRVKNLIEQMTKLNGVLDKYDKKKKSFWNKLTEAFNNFFGVK